VPPTGCKSRTAGGLSEVVVRHGHCIVAALVALLWSSSHAETQSQPQKAAPSTGLLPSLLSIFGAPAAAKPKTVPRQARPNGKQAPKARVAPVARPPRAPSKQTHIDAAAQERLFRQFLEWNRKQTK
jgi:hypothetical protein